MEKIVRVRLSSQPPIADMATGEAFNVWGHPFIMQKDGMLVCDMPDNVAKLELKNGRCVRYVPEDFKVVENAFGNDIGNYYGAGDLDTLRQKVEKLTKDEIQQFVEPRLNMSWPNGMSKKDMVDNTCKAIENLRADDGGAD